MEGPMLPHVGQTKLFFRTSSNFKTGEVSWEASTKASRVKSRNLFLKEQDTESTKDDFLERQDGNGYQK